MLLLTLILIPIFGAFLISSNNWYESNENKNNLKIIALTITILDLIVSLIIWLLFDNSCKHMQFVQEHYVIGYYDFYLGIDGLSIYFILLTTLIMPIAIISNWKSINEKKNIFW